MPRPSSQQYICEPLKLLAAQLSRSPAARRVEQIQHAEQLHDSIDPAQNYPLSFLIFRITATRPGTTEETILAGEAIRPDLRLLIDQLSRNVELLIEQVAEEAWSLEALAKHIQVSTKTLQRWRKQGLRWRWMRATTNAPRTIYITESAWQHFSAMQQSRVQFASGFSQLTDDQRQKILIEARNLAATSELSANQIAQRLARQTGRALETIRQLIQKHDRDNPDDVIMHQRHGPMTPRQQRVMVRAYRMGISVSKIASHLRRTRSTVYRILHQARADKIRHQRISFIASPLFERDDAQEVLLRDDLQALENKSLNAESSTDALVAELPAILQPLYRQPTLNNESLRSLVVRYNYLKFRCDAIRRTLDPMNPRVSSMDQFDAFQSQAARCRQLLVRFNLPVVLSVARRQTIGIRRPPAMLLISLLEMGNIELYEVIEQYNSRLKLTFSSVLRNRLLGRYAREATAVIDAQPYAVRRDEPKRALQRMIATAQTYRVNLKF